MSEEEEDAFVAPATQEEFDRMVGQRLARERSKFSDYDDLKTKAARLDEIEQQSKSEVQRLQDELKARDTQLADAPKEARRQAIRFAAKANTKGFVDPEVALMLIDADLADDAAVDAALDDLAKSRPHLVREEPKQKLPQRPKPKAGDAGNTEADGDLKGKERAAAALRQLRNA